LIATHRYPDWVGAGPDLGRIGQDDLVVAAGLVAEAAGEAHGPDVAAERPGHAVDPAQQYRGGVVQASAVAKELVGGGEAQVVALVVGGDGGIALMEQLGEGQQIELMALEARPDQHRPRIPAWWVLSAYRQGDSAGIAARSSGHRLRQQPDQRLNGDLGRTSARQLLPGAAKGCELSGA
jgi:hypothetical protein